MIRETLVVGVVACAIAAPASACAQGQSLDTTVVALTYHKLSGQPLDLQAAAQTTTVVRSASNFDHDDVMKHEMARIGAQLDSVDKLHEFVVRVDDNISEFDHARGEFSIVLFEPGYSVPFNAFGQRYQLVFANADAMRAIPMPKDQARLFDASLNSFGRRVVDEIHFRVTGAGDPSGAVTGPRVVRAEIVSARILDPSGRVVAAPSAARTPAATVAAFNVLNADVAGLTVGTRAEDLVAALKRLFGDVTREPISKPVYPGLATTLTVNDMGCFSMPGRSKNAAPGAVCVTANVDDQDIVRTIRIERVFPWMDSEVFRAALVKKYGPVAGAQNGTGLTLGWGPQIPPELLYDRSGPPYALTAQYVTNNDYMSRGLNELPQIRVILSLVDASWAKTK
ncbi:MAG: hypothetical protein ABI026_07965 [Gemmatimonadaceae bacterium]